MFEKELGEGGWVTVCGSLWIVLQAFPRGGGAVGLGIKILPLLMASTQYKLVCVCLFIHMYICACLSSSMPGGIHPASLLHACLQACTQHGH